MVTVAVIGGGGWGKNHVRNFHEIQTCRPKNICDPNEKIRIYDKGVDMAGSVVGYEQSLSIRSGDILIPKTPGSEPLRIECLHFLECVKKGKTPRSDGHDGLRVVRVLDAATRSLKAGGAPVSLSPFSKTATEAAGRLPRKADHDCT